MNVADKHLRALCARALELGADGARPISAREVVVDPRVTLKCRVPLCPSYGNNLMCPPYAPGPVEFGDALRRYDHGILVQQAIPVTASELKRRFRGKSLEQLSASKAYSTILADSQNAFGAVLTALEAEAQGLGYGFAAALTGGDCCLCPSCTAEGAAGGPAAPCRRPFQARPSMEAVGIDVVVTAAAAGLPIEMPAAERPVWTGMVLVA